MNPIYGQSVTPVYAPEQSYPVAVEFRQQETYSRFWAFPVVGYYAKLIILFPHYFVLTILALVSFLLQLITWVPVLLTGRYPVWAYTFNVGWLRWGNRVLSFHYGMTDRYPSFGFQEDAGGREPLLQVQQPYGVNRLWAVPVVGFVAKKIVLIPHLILLAVLVLVVAMLLCVSWIPVLFTGRFPAWAETLFGGFIRYSTRVYAYTLGLTDVYPPFQLSS